MSDNARAADSADKRDDKAAKDKSVDEAAPPVQDEVALSEHSVEIAGKKLDYTAAAGTYVLRADDGAAKAHLFFIAYTKKDAGEVGRRPLTYCFNGGPGSSSVWLHLGLLGPRRVALPAEPVPAAPPYQLVPNEFSLLDVTDLVFIDPVSTGYSRPAKGEKKEKFHGYQQDLDSVGEFIHLYTTRHGRWASPRFVLGESYGALRAAGLAGHLRDRYHMELNGVALVSPVVNFQTIRFDLGNDLPYVMFLPSYAATAHKHGRLAADLQAKPLPELLAEVEKFAYSDYNAALMLGSNLPADEQAKIAAVVGRYTGLGADFVDRSNLRVRMKHFAKELLRDQRRTVGRLDSRYLGIDRDAVDDTSSYDPSDSAIAGAFASTMNHYLHAELKFTRDIPYEVTSDAVHPWNYETFSNRYADASEPLRQAMTQNPRLRVFAACGYYDLATPYLATNHTFAHLALDPTLRKNVSLAYYDAGHMMYVNPPDLRKLRDDLRDFYEAADGVERP